MTRTIVSIFIAMILSSCTFDEVVISMLPNIDDPIFYFRYLKDSKEPVSLSSVRIHEATSKKLMWEISTFDPTVLWIFVDGTPDGRRVPRKEPVEYGKLISVPLAEVIFGTVPPGFIQYFPVDNRKPVLNRTVKYIVSADGSGGRMLFTLDGKCRRISSTGRSKGNPLFNNESSCIIP